MNLVPVQREYVPYRYLKILNTKEKEKNILKIDHKKDFPKMK